MPTYQQSTKHTVMFSEVQKKNFRTSKIGEHNLVHSACRSSNRGLLNVFWYVVILCVYCYVFILLPCYGLVVFIICACLVPGPWGPWDPFLIYRRFRGVSPACLIPRNPEIDFVSSSFSLRAVRASEAKLHGRMQTVILIAGPPGS